MTGLYSYELCLDVMPSIALAILQPWKEPIWEQDLYKKQGRPKKSNK